MTYRQAITYLNNFVNYEKKDYYSYRKSFRLGRMKGFLRLLGNPQDSLKCLHIAGSKGKGSVCIFAANILRSAGYSVGLYTSPHLSDARERIRVLSRTNHDPQITYRESRPTSHEFEGMISRRELAALVERLKPAIKEYNSRNRDQALTFFEVWTALAFLYFKEKQVDYAVLETGLGGRLDATNAVNPLVCGITPISYDHTQYLGNTLRQIAKEKAGIIKERQSAPRLRSGQARAPEHQMAVISALQEKEAREAIRKRCVQKKAKLYEIGRDILSFSRKPAALPLGRRESRHLDSPVKPGNDRPLFRAGGQSFDLQGIKRRYNNLEIRLLGRHQLGNAALAVGMVEALGDQRIKPAHIRRGLKAARWPGRLEVISRNPYIVLDGAQNAASALALKEAIRDNFHYQRLILVVGMSRDKDISGLAAEFYDFCDIVVLTKSDNPRAANPRDLAGYFTGKWLRLWLRLLEAAPSPSGLLEAAPSPSGLEIFLSDSVKKAITKAKAMAKKEDLILVTGSLFVVGEALNA